MDSVSGIVYFNYFRDKVLSLEIRKIDMFTLHVESASVVYK